MGEGLHAAAATAAEEAAVAAMAAAHQSYSANAAFDQKSQVQRP